MLLQIKYVSMYVVIKVHETLNTERLPNKYLSINANVQKKINKSNKLLRYDKYRIVLKQHIHLNNTRV